MSHDAQELLTLLQNIDIHEVDLQRTDIATLLHAVVVVLAH